MTQPTPTPSTSKFVPHLMFEVTAEAENFLGDEKAIVFYLAFDQRHTHDVKRAIDTFINEKLSAVEWKNIRVVETKIATTVNIWRPIIELTH